MTSTPAIPPSTGAPATAPGSTASGSTASGATTSGATMPAARRPTTPWTMAGTALARARAAHPAIAALPERWAGPPPLEDKARALVQGAPELWTLAWELARLVGPASPSAGAASDGADAADPARAREALLHLAFALLVLAHRGSTVVPRDARGAKALGEVLDAASPSPPARALIEGLWAGAAVPAPLAPFIASAPIASPPIASPPIASPSIASPAASTAAPPSQDDAPVVRAPDVVALHRFLRMEARLAASLALLIAQPPIAVDGDGLGRALAAVRARTPRPWTEEQQLAVLNAVHLPFTVIAGGPGTGKTTVVVGLLRLLVRLGVKPGAIALAAPTGKAANRMYEVVRDELASDAQRAPEDEALGALLPPPRTLHRLLGYSAATDRFRHDEHNPLGEDVIIVDECSMVDLSLMDQLMRACRPRAPGAPPRRLILLGDSHQLPSVEAGMVLHHLAENDAPGAPRVPPVLARPWLAHVERAPAGAGPDDGALGTLVRDDHAGPRDPRSRFVVTLTKSHRMNPKDPDGRAIAVCARAILARDLERLRPPHDDAARPHTTPDTLLWKGVEHLDASLEKSPPTAFFEAWWSHRIAPAAPLPSGFTVEELEAHVYRVDGGDVRAEDQPRLTALLRHTESQRILCLNRGDQPSGAARANAWFTAKRGQLRDQQRAGAGAQGRRSRTLRGFFAGEPVLFLRNDYHLRLFNGDPGVVAWTQVDGGEARLRVVFPRATGPEVFDLEAAAPHLTRAYALTVHKAQGSQVEAAALLLPHEQDNPLLVNPLVYTAVSRASRSVVVVGSLDRLITGTERMVPRFCSVMSRVEALIAPRCA